MDVLKFLDFNTVGLEYLRDLLDFLDCNFKIVCLLKYEDLQLNLGELLVEDSEKLDLVLQYLIC